MKESDLFFPIKSWLIKDIGCNEVYGEVGLCDILGLSGPMDIIVETKTRLSFKLLDQVRDRLNYAPYVYMAVPIPKGRKWPARVIREFMDQNKIGLIYVDMHADHHPIYVFQKAKFNHHFKKMRKVYSIRHSIRNYSSKQVGGVKGGESITDYSETIRIIKGFMRREGWVTVDQILEVCETHYASPKPSVMATLQATWNQSWCETKKEGRLRYFRMKRNAKEEFI
ncbi:hypothetical protein NOM01_04405 [Sporolactobacillus sp. STSJ-5]|uniref:hypothetical protein n=1 Tax=Sporolactobacillus sp. STSJ-5 TaxID=2965076 RepID=UPI002107672E|nr:hypothetical protein [Sporolactobacillus sp. STSJ-5]MCQ2009235.1 hypothetical protein [Sporolactobacillus sp. STSJ-5]